MRTQGTIAIAMSPVPNYENGFTMNVVVHGRAKKPLKVQFDLIMIINEFLILRHLTLSTLRIASADPPLQQG